MAFKVIQGHRCWYQLKACDFLLVVNTNGHHISPFAVIVQY